MSAHKHAYVNDAYRRWQETHVPVAGRPIVLASKPGVLAHGGIDASSQLLARHVVADAGQVVVHLNCGNGLLGAALALAGDAGRIVLADRNVLAVEAAVRTLRANGVTHTGSQAGSQAGTQVEVHVGHGAAAFPDLVADIVAIRMPKEKLALLQLLHEAFALLVPGGQCWLAGATDEGAKTAAKTLGALFGDVATVATDGGHRIVHAVKRADRVAAGAPTTPFIDRDAFHEQVHALRGRAHTFSSRPGVFSWDELDEATAILAEHMDVRPDDRVLDLGCGYGVLGVVAGQVARAHGVTMVDVDAEAVRCATRSAAAAGLEGVRVLGSDAAAAVLEERFDLVVTNPPFHVGKATDLSVPIQFIADAFTVLAPGGRLALVANRTLPYEGAIRYLFRNVTTVHDGRRFKVLAATKAG